MSSAPHFAAECLWPNVTRTDVEALTRRLALHGRDGVDHLGTTLIPTDEVVFVWFSSTQEADVRDACLRASVPFDRVIGIEGWPAASTTSSRIRERP